MIKGFFSKTKDVAAAQPPQLSTAIADSIFKVIGPRGIPTMPGAAQRAFKLATDPNAEVREFIEVIEADEALSARVLKIANSVYYDRGRPSQSIEEAVTKIGSNELRSLLSATSLSEIFPSRHEMRQEFWAHDIGTALVARSLAERLCPAKRDALFLGGLMHDIGKLLLLQRLGSEYLKSLDLVQEKGLDFCEAEQELFVFNHTEVGQIIGEKWNFSVELIEMIRRHHDTWANLHQADGSLTLPGIVAAANIIAHAAGLGHSPRTQRIRQRAEESLIEVCDLAGITTAERRPFIQELQRTFKLEYDLYAGSSGRQ